MDDFNNWFTIESVDSLTEIINKNNIVCALFSQPNCNVCLSLKPQLEELITNIYPEVKLAYIDLQLNPELSGKYTVFTIPTIIIFVEAKEYFRKSRIINLKQLSDNMDRLFDIIK